MQLKISRPSPEPEALQSDGQQNQTTTAQNLKLMTAGPANAQGARERGKTAHQYRSGKKRMGGRPACLFSGFLSLKRMGRHHEPREPLV
jgi:hypothetical protein